MQGWSESTATSEAHSTIDVNTTSKTHSKAKTKSRASAKARNSTWSTAVGYATTFVPEIEMLATQTYTLEEQRYNLARRIARQPKRHAFLCLLGEGTVGFRTRDVEDVFNLRSEGNGSWSALSNNRSG